MITKNIIIDNVKTIFYALVIAIIIRSLFIQPFYIPSSSMEPTLLIGDRLFVTKYSYGYSKHSFPFSPPIINGKLFSKKPKVGDVIVFKTPADNRTDYIKIRRWHLAHPRVLKKSSINFPINIIFKDGSENEIANMTELAEAKSNCKS